MTRHFKAECTLNLKILLRQPGFWIPTVMFPAMLYSFFGAQSAGGQWAANAMASFMVYAVMGVGFFQFGVSVAQDRESPFASWQRSLPGSQIYQWLARGVSAVLFSTMGVLLVILMAYVLADVILSPDQWARIAVVCFCSTLTATAMGIALGSWVSARASVPIANLIYLPLAYLGGLWVPPMFMPHVIKLISDWTPTRAMGELGWAAVNGTSWEPRYMGLLAAWTLLAVLLALLAQMRFRKLKSA